MPTEPDTAPGGAAVATVLRTTATLGLLAAAAPLNAAVTAAALLRRAAVGPSRPAVAAEPRTILVSGGKMTKAIQLARSFHSAGHRVILVEGHKYRHSGHRHSNAVDRFYTVPDPTDDRYAGALLDIVVREGVDVYVPVCSPVASWYDAKAKELLEGHCEVVHCDADMVATLDDKASFAELATSLGLDVPESRRITDPRQVVELDPATEGRYILKSIPYDPVHRLDLTRLPAATPEATARALAGRTISPERPWVLQEFVAGQEYCTHATVRDGRLQVHLCCESSASQLNYEMVDKPAIEAWVRHFVGALGLTGQVSLDFIEAADGTVRAIECNPRTHSAVTMLYDHPDVARAYLEPGVDTVVPLASSRPTYWLYNELWRLLRHPADAPDRVRTLWRGKDAIFDWDDPLPFLMVHHEQIPSLLLHNLRHLKPWVKIDFNIGKLVEPAGD